MMTYRSLLLAVAVAALASGCSSQIGSDIAQQCTEELSAANAELDKAQADGFGGAVSVTKAASLIAAAAIQKQFEKYEGCLDKAQRARAFIADANKK
jgi:uncharacterized protein YceK